MENQKSSIVLGTAAFGTDTAINVVFVLFIYSNGFSIASNNFLILPKEYLIRLYLVPIGGLILFTILG